jgi:hyperosmotically inducible periplasmic protein
MQARQFLTAMTLAAAFFAGSTAVMAQDPDTKPDNTKVNKRDRDKTEPTADQQKENKGDRMLAKNIRRAIMDDKSLSTYAHNIKIIAQNGTVTLKGPVHSDEEKRAIEAKAAEIAGAGNVRNEISVKGDQEADREKKQ